MAKFTAKPIEWERRKAPHEGMTDCIICTFPKPDSSGYVRIRRNGGTNKYLHRLVCERRHGSLGSLMATHSCDVRSCINPDHLFPGTQKQNMEGAVARKRTAFGARQGSTNLTDELAKEILHARGFLKSIGLKFGVSPVTVWNIKHRVSWRHIE